MPTLVLARHAKAQAPDCRVEDHDRELLPEGRQAALRLGERLAELGIVPELVLVSSSARTRGTADAVLSTFPGARVVEAPDLYEAAPARYLGVIATAADASTVLVIGHEPTTSAVSAWLAGPGSLKQPLQRLTHGMPTSGAAVLEVDVTWDALAPRCARLVHMVEGKHL